MSKLFNLINEDPKREIDVDTGIVLYIRSWQKLIEEGLLRQSDYEFYQRTIDKINTGRNITNCNVTYVDVNQRVVIAAGESSWNPKVVIYLNESYFTERSDVYDVIDVEGMANFPESLKLCRLKSTENRIWTLQASGNYIINFAYYPEGSSRQARVIEILADLEEPIVPLNINNTDSPTFASLLASDDFMKQVDDVLKKK